MQHYLITLESDDNKIFEIVVEQGIGEIVLGGYYEIKPNKQLNKQLRAYNIIKGICIMYELDK